MYEIMSTSEYPTGLKIYNYMNYKVLDFLNVDNYLGLYKLDVGDEIHNHPLFEKVFTITREAHYELSFKRLD
jgi:hypothetical protein